MEVCILSIHFQSTSLSRGKTKSEFRLRILRSFQSTSLSRGKTKCDDASTLNHIFQSTSLSRGKTFVCSVLGRLIFFQSTSLSRGKTGSEDSSGTSPLSFNPLPSHEGRPQSLSIVFSKLPLSIHFPLTREDTPV